MTAAIIVALLAVFCAVMAWRSHRTASQALDAMGMQYGVKRWEGESNDEYMMRISNRMLITGGKRSWR